MKNLKHEKNQFFDFKKIEKNFKENLLEKKISEKKEKILKKFHKNLKAKIKKKLTPPQLKSLQELDNHLKTLSELESNLSKTQKSLLKNSQEKNSNFFKNQKNLQKFQKEFSPYINTKIYNFTKTTKKNLKLKQAERISKNIKYVFSEDPKEPLQVIGEYYEDLAHLSNSSNFENINKTEKKLLEEKARQIYVRVPWRFYYKLPDFEKEYELDDLDMDLHFICHSHNDLGWVLTLDDLTPGKN